MWFMLPSPVLHHTKVEMLELTTTNADTQYVIADKKHQFALDMASYREYLGVELTLKQHIVTEIEPKYLNALRSGNTVTKKIMESIPVISKHLFDTYGDISS